MMLGIKIKRMFLLLVILFASGVKAETCSIAPIYNQGSDIKFGSYSAHLMNPDSPEKPTAWQGPIIISNASGKECSVDLNIIGTSFYAGSHYLYVWQFSGSSGTQILLDADTCARLWVSPAFTGIPQLVGGNIFKYGDAKPVEIGPDCRPAIKTPGSL